MHHYLKILLDFFRNPLRGRDLSQYGGASKRCTRAPARNWAAKKVPGDGGAPLRPAPRSHPLKARPLFCAPQSPARYGFERSLFLSILLSIAGCSSLPNHQYNSGGESSDDAPSKTLALHEEMAKRYEASGDLASAVNEWHILTLLAPKERSYQDKLITTKETIRRLSNQAFTMGMASYRKKQLDETTRYMLKVLALFPDRTEAAQVLREIEKQKMASIQNLKATKAAKTVRYQKKMDEIDTSNKSTLDPDQQIELFTAGDTTGGLREMRLYVEANPGEKQNRQRIANAVCEEAQKRENQGAEEDALRLYEQALFLRGDKYKPWEQRLNALRSKLASEYYGKGVQIYNKDISAAIQYWEKTLSIDPYYNNAALRLKEAKKLKEKLKNF